VIVRAEAAEPSRVTTAKTPRAKRAALWGERSPGRISHSPGWHHDRMDKSPAPFRFARGRCRVAHIEERRPRARRSQRRFETSTICSHSASM